MGERSVKPKLEQWYSHDGEQFKVVCLDEDDGIVEVQYADGMIEEIELEDWDQLEDLITIDQPMEFDDEDEDGEAIDEDVPW